MHGLELVHLLNESSSNEFLESRATNWSWAAQLNCTPSDGGGMVLTVAAIVVLAAMVVEGRGDKEKRDVHILTNLIKIK